MDEGNNPEDTGGCFNFTTGLIIIAGIDTACAIISILACLFVILLILIYKKFCIFFQRINLYITIAAAVYSIATATGASGYYPMHDQYNFNAYCIWSGFFYQVTAWMLVGAVCIGVADVYLRVVLYRDTHKYELIYIGIIFGLPFITSWLPFIESTYGQDGPWCWIRVINNDRNCSTHVYGLVLQFAIWYIPLILTCIGVVIIYALLLHDIRKRKYQGKYDPRIEELRRVQMKVVKPYLIFPWLFIVITVLAAANAVSGVLGKNQVYLVPLWGINAVLTPLQGGILALLFGLDAEMLQRLFCQKPCASCREDDVVDYSISIHSRLSFSYSSAMKEFVRKMEPLLTDGTASSRLST